MTIATLIDKQDNFEIIRDQIAVILATEVASQMVLADDAGKDPDDWKLRIYTERANPWDLFGRVTENTDRSPIVNVWFDNSNFEMSSSNIVERQKCTAVYNIDCYGVGLSADVVDGGHIPGDRDAAFQAQRAIRLVRNILMAADYTYLDLPRGTVWRRWPQSIIEFQPLLDSNQAQQINALRLAFNVEFNEFSPQIPTETLEYLSVDVKRAEDGEIIVEADYDYTI